MRMLMLKDEHGVVLLRADSASDRQVTVSRPVDEVATRRCLCHKAHMVVDH